GPAASATWWRARCGRRRGAAANCPRPMTERSALLHGMPAFALAGSMAACDGDPSSRADLAAHAEAARQPAELQIGDVTIRASLVPTASLSPAIAQRYGVEPEHGAQLLLVEIGRAHV